MVRVSKQSPSTPMGSPRAAGYAEGQKPPAEKYWLKRVFKNTYTRNGETREVGNWSVKIQHQGRRRTFSLLTLDRQAAAAEARAIHEKILAEGWEAALKSKMARQGFQKTKARYWRDHLVLRRYRFPASGESPRSLAAQIGHAGAGYYFPLFTEDFAAAAAAAARIYAAAAKQGWETVCGLYPRELIVAFAWSADPIMWTYTTVHTLPAKNPGREAEAKPQHLDAHRVLVVETDAGLSRALQWCINHQPGFRAIACKSPETFTLALELHKPRLVLLNRSLLERLGVALPGGLGYISSGSLGLAYSAFPDGDQMFVSTPGGAEGYLLKRVSPTCILDPALSKGDLPGVAQAPLESVKRYFGELLMTSSGPKDEGVAKLTPREKQVLLLMTEGRVDKEIAQALRISAWTVREHIKKIFERLHVHTRTEAVVRYLEK